jgi:hypothetical protein
MPKRIVDGDALWLSEKVRNLPTEYRLHYANWLPLAEANGVFEADIHRIRARVYSYLLPDISSDDVRDILRAFTEAGLVKIWQEDNKNWGYFVGIEKPGRLPALGHLSRYKNLPPSPHLD